MALGHNAMCTCTDCDNERNGRGGFAGLIIEINDRAPTVAPKPPTDPLVDLRVAVQAHLAILEELNIAELSDELADSMSVLDELLEADETPEQRAYRALRERSARANAASKANAELARAAELARDREGTDA